MEAVFALIGASIVFSLMHLVDLRDKASFDRVHGADHKRWLVFYSYE